MQTLREFEGKVILTYDNDAAGRRGVEKFESLRKKYMMPTFYICTPPAKYKDWNEAHVKGIDLLDWVLTNSTEYNFQYQIKCQLKRV